MIKMIRKTAAICMAALIATTSLPATVTNFSTIQVHAAEVSASTKWYSQNADTFQISTAEDLMGLAQLVNSGTDFSGKTITLTNDIDLSTVDNWTPIGSYSGSSNKAFKGTFDGNSKTISNLRIEDSTDYTDQSTVSNLITNNYGLFSYTSRSTIKNLTVKGNISFSKPVNHTRVTTKGFTGGIVAYAFNSTIENCSFEGNITAGYIVGGIVGRGLKATIKNCHVDNSAITGSYYVGGIAGQLYGNASGASSIDNSKVKGSIKATIQYAGGVIGSTTSPDANANTYKTYICNINNCSTLNGTIVDSKYSAGGIVSDSCSEIKNCVNYANVNDNGLVNGGSAGIAQGLRVNVGEGIVNCINYGNISSNGNSSPAAGIVRTGASLKLTNVANIGTIKSVNDEAYGIICNSNTSVQPEITNGFNLGVVTGTTSDLLGKEATYTKVYFDNTLGNSSFGTPKDAKDFKDRTVVDLLNGDIAEDDNIIWYQNEDYPDFGFNMKLVKTITVPETFEVAVGKTSKLETSVTPDDATVKTVLYSNSDDAIATVSEDGTVTGNKEGETTITVTALDSGLISGTVKVTVKAPEAEKQPFTPSQPSAPATDNNTVASGTTVTVGTNNYIVINNTSVAFAGSTNAKATKISIPATVKIGAATYKVTSVSANAFKGNKKIKSVTIGSNVTSIGKTAFANCKKLTSVVIGKNVKTIGSKAFYGCSKLKKITVKSKVLKKVGSKAFKGIHKNAVIKVPSKKLKAYKKLLKGKGQKSTVKISK